MTSPVELVPNQYHNTSFSSPSFLKMQERHWPAQPSKIPSAIFSTKELVVGKANADSNTLSFILADTLATLKKEVADDAAGHFLENQ